MDSTKTSKEFNNALNQAITSESLATTQRIRHGTATKDSNNRMMTANEVLAESIIDKKADIEATKGQIESGLSLGFNRIDLLRKIIFPIALRKVLPSYGNELILMVKATSLVSLTTYMEMTGIARKIMAKTFAPVEAFIAAGILYLFLNFLMVQFVKYLEWKYNPHLRVEQT